MGKAFLQLLVTQMRYQDPSPQITVLFSPSSAQFSALEQMQNLIAKWKSCLPCREPSAIWLRLILSFGHRPLFDPVKVEGTVTTVEFAGGQTQLVIGGKTCALRTC